MTVLAEDPRPDPLLLWGPYLSYALLVQSGLQHTSKVAG